MSTTGPPPLPDDTAELVRRFKERNPGEFKAEEAVVIRDTNTRDEAAVALRIAGAPWYAIAKTCGFDSEEQAQTVVLGVLAASATVETKEDLRNLASQRLEKLLSLAWQSAGNAKSAKQLPAMREARQIIETWIELHGLQAPQQHVVYNPTAKEIQGFIETITRQKANDLPEEVDIVDAEEVWDE